MSPPGTAREALLAEALGDLGRLLDRLDAIAPRIDAAARTLNTACDRLEHQADQLDQQVATLTERAKLQAVRHIAGRTDELARQTLAQQARAMEAAAKAIFVREAQLASEQLSARSSPAARRRRTDPTPWVVALLSAVLASVCTWMAAMWIMPLR